MGFLPDIGDIVAAVAEVADDLHTSDEEREKLGLQRYAIDASLLKGQIEVNKAASSHPSIFVAGARPFVLWVCGFALAWQFIIYHFLVFLAWLFLDDKFVIASIPRLDSTELMTVLTGLLGIGGLRTYEKLKGKATTHVSDPFTGPE